jgi:hypothetical protein
LKGRVDDNIDILSKRHKAYFETTLPVIITTLFVWLS